MGRICKECGDPLSAALIKEKPFAEICRRCLSKHDENSEPERQSKAVYLTRTKKQKAERTKKTKAERKANHLQ
jgi:hypothetical protein